MFICFSCVFTHWSCLKTFYFSKSQWKFSLSHCFYFKLGCWLVFRFEIYIIFGCYFYFFIYLFDLYVTFCVQVVLVKRCCLRWEANLESSWPGWQFLGFPAAGSPRSSWTSSASVPSTLSLLFVRPSQTKALLLHFCTSVTIDWSQCRDLLGSLLPSCGFESALHQPCIAVCVGVQCGQRPMHILVYISQSFLPS